MAKPENTAPETKYGGNIVVCQPGITDVAKSKETIECTEKTNGVANPARTSDTISNLFQAFASPVQPKLNTLYTLLASGLVTLSLIVAKSGIKPMYQNTKDTEKYVDMAKTSQSSGELKFTHKDPN